MIANAEIVVNTSGIDNLNKSIITSPARAEKFFVNEVKKGVFITDLFELLRRKPRTPQYPLKWFSEKQRIKVIIELKKAGNLPYKRTGAASSAWKIVEISANASSELRAVNDTPYIGYVMGIKQQPMFPQWQHAPTLVTSYGALAAAQLREGWQQIAEGNK